MNSTDANILPTTPTKGWNRRPSLRKMVGLLDSPRVMNIALGILLLMAAWFRFYGINWDEGRHLHPDERFLSTVTNDLKWPDTWEFYFDPNVSTLSPYTLPDMGLFVYGTFPITIVKIAAIVLNQDNYDQITYLGRFLSGLFDIGAIYLLFLIGKRLYSAKVGLLAAALLALSVLNIQLSHFYAVDTFANFFIVATIYSLLRATDSGRWLDYVITGLLFGLGLASKISTLTLAVPIFIAVGYAFTRRAQSGDLRAVLEHCLVRLLTILLVAFFTFRIVQPVAFSGPGFLDLSPNIHWQQDIEEQQNIVSGKVDLPWVQQWTNRSATFPLYNILLWGMGLPLGLAGFAGLALAAYELVRRGKLEHLLPVSYVLVTFIYHSLTFIKFMRYFFPIYPFLALLAAYLLVWLWQRFPAPELDETAEQPSEGRRIERLARRFRQDGQFRAASLVTVFTALAIGGTFLYALAFSAIYTQPNTRIAASRWLYENIPAGKTLANEHWDDWLPIGGLDGKTAYGEAGMFQSVEMRNYEADTPEKLNWMVDNLAKADYIVLSSNRLYDSIPRLPVRYPLASRYYELLFRGELGFDRIKDFTAYPRLLGIQLPDQSAEESFSVYDHPRVQIYQKTAAFNADQVREKLGQGIQWHAVTQVNPWQATVAPRGLLLTSSEQDLYQRAAVNSSQKVNANSWGSRSPVLAWVLVLQVIALLALPLTFAAFSNLADRGYIFSKALGLLLVGWGAWLLASLRIMPFTWWAILIVVLLLSIVSAWFAQKYWDALRDFIRTHWRLILLEEALFWLFFVVLLTIRLQNPDLWHPGMGGEKPMDLAYLTAIVRTPFFPSYDPWFTGGYINYYYFGFVLVATLIHLTGIVPHVAYNLALPTLFAMTAMGGFSVAYNLADRFLKKDAREAAESSALRRGLMIAGICGALFVAVIGNLSQIELIYNGVREMSVIETQDGATALTSLAQFMDGLNQWVVERQPLPIRTDWWYWNATRVIPPGEGEAGPINEMPFFTFLFGDLHAHMMALPYTLLVLGLAVNIVRDDRKTVLDGKWRKYLPDVLSLGLLGLATGALWPINTWDFPTYLLLSAAALAFREYARRGRIDLPGLWAVAWRVGVVLLVGRVLFLPFHSNYAGSYLGAELWEGSKTTLKPYLLIHGFFLFVLSTYLIIDLLYTPGHNMLIRGIRRKLPFLRATAAEEPIPPVGPANQIAADLSIIALALTLVILLVNPVIGLALGLSLLTLLLILHKPSDLGDYAVRQFLRLMILLGLMLTVVVEIVVLQGDISRMNTVFKFYLQVWVLFATASAAVLPELAARIRSRTPATVPSPRISEPPEGSAWTPEIAAQLERMGKRSAGQVWARRWWWVFGLLLGICFLYPITAAPVKMRDRFEGSTSVTLDGSTYMRTSTYYDEDRPVTLEWDRQAITWLRQNVRGIPTILEANTPLYRWGSRVSINTGLPTLIGWDWHQKQQRSVFPGQLIERRQEDVKTIYNSTDLEQTKTLLQQYGIQYIYVGPLESLYYNADGLKKFDQPEAGLTLVYQNEQVKIYQVK